MLFHTTTTAVLAGGGSSSSSSSSIATLASAAAVAVTAGSVHGCRSTPSWRTKDGKSAAGRIYTDLSKLR